MTGVIEAVLKIIFWPPIYQYVIVPGLIASLLVVITILWFERKAAARVQMRIGPYNVSPKLKGYLQLIADLVRYAFQEIVVPRTADAAAFLLAPLLLLIFTLLPLVAIPVSPLEWTWPIPMKYSVLVALALSVLSPIFLILMGWASNNRFATIGGIREAFLITAYELVAVLSILSVSAALRTFDFVEIVEAQQGFKWLILYNPLAFLAGLIAILMSTSGFPFEIPEAEHEIVAGPFTEYTGIVYGLNMGAAYMKRYALSVLLVLAFLGGWAPYTPPANAGYVAGYLIPSIIVVVKAAILMAVMSFLRAVYGRYRIDQALDVGWRLIFTLALLGLGLGLLQGYLGVI